MQGTVETPIAGLGRRPIRRWALWVATGLLAVGIAAALYGVRVKIHYDVNETYQADCAINATFDCGSVMTRDEYAMVMGTPIALWGFALYLVMLVLVWFGFKPDHTEEEGGGPPSQERAASALNILMLLSALAALYSIYLFSVSHWVIKTFCPICMVMYVVNIGVLSMAILASPDDLPGGLVGGVKGAISANGPTMAAVSVFVLSMLIALPWYNHEKDVIYHGTARAKIAECETLLAKDKALDCQKALGKLALEPGPYYAYAHTLYTRAQKRIDRPVTKAEIRSAPKTDEDRELEAKLNLGASSKPTATAKPVSAKSPARKPVAPKTTPKPVAKPTPPATAKTTRPTKPISGVKRARITKMGYGYFEVPIRDNDFVLGKPDAPVTIVEFADFECAYCRMLSSNLKKIRQKYADKVRFVFKYYPMDGTCNPYMGGQVLHKNACNCAKASYCAGKQGKFWEAHDLLFAKQGELEDPKVRGYMESLKLNMGTWDACMKSDEPLQRIRQDTMIARLARIDGTPRTYINNRLVSGAATVSILEYYIQTALKNPNMQASETKAVAPTDTMSPMVAVKTAKGTVYIDRYEASIDKQGRAVSLPGVLPRTASWFDAKASCEKAGKRICSEEEWISACAGQPAVDNNNNRWFNDDTIEGTRYPYGPFYQRGNCHDGQKTIEGKGVKTGTMHKCRTPTGIYDLTGNLNEWIGLERNRASQVGGHFGSGEGAACNRRGSMFGPGNRNNTIGFRCCADTMVKNVTTTEEGLMPADGKLVGKPVPKFNLKTTTGKDIGPATWKGKVSYITFYAYWCGSCKRELPEIRKWQAELKSKGFQVVAIGVDKNSKMDETFIAKYDPNYDVAMDPDAKTMGLFSIVAMPTSFIIDRQGIIRHKIVGFKKEEVPTTRAIINNLLKKK
jgi:protein-disulfide isomerase/uncharacterized membrane protein